MEYIAGKAALKYWGIKGVYDILNEGEKEEIVVFSPTDTALRRKGSWCSIPVASKYTKGKYCTLPYIFFRYASRLSLIELIFLGMQICGVDKESSSKKMCSVRKLRDCAIKLAGLPGRRKALQAVKYIVDNSYSPRESWLYMLLCLPNRFGGCGFPKPILNYEIQSGRNKFYGDIYFPSHRLIIEYDSFKHHNNTQSFSYDSMRDVVLENMGFKVIHVTPGHLATTAGFKELVYYVARSLNKSVRIRTPKYFESFYELFNLWDRNKFNNSLNYNTNNSKISNNSSNTQLKRIVKLTDVPQLCEVSKTYERYIKAKLK